MTEEELLKKFRSMVHQELNDREGLRALRKNGDTWPEWLMKHLTIQNIAIAVLLIYQLGGRVVRYDDAVETARIAAETARVAATAVQKQEQLSSEFLGDLNRLDGLLERHSAQLKAQEDTNRLLSEQVRLNVTRGEFQRVVQQQLVPRLERIEKGQQ